MPAQTPAIIRPARGRISCLCPVAPFILRSCPVGARPDSWGPTGGGASGRQRTAGTGTAWHTWGARPSGHTLAGSKREDPLMPTSSAAQRAGLDVLQIDDQLTQDERLVRDTIRAYTADRVLPHIADWFEAGILPRELAPELGKLRLLGMHLTGYGCAGMGSVAYGVACRELEAGDSRLRSLGSVHGSLAMYPIWRYGSDEQKEEWLPRMATGEALARLGLNETVHGSDPANMKTKGIHNGIGRDLIRFQMGMNHAASPAPATVCAPATDAIRGFAA